MDSSWFFCIILLINSIDISFTQFSVYDQTVIPFSIYNTGGNPNNIITNSKILFYILI